MTKTYIDELVEEIARLRDYYAKAITRETEMAERRKAIGIKER